MPVIVFLCHEKCTLGQLLKFVIRLMSLLCCSLQQQEIWQNYATQIAAQKYVTRGTDYLTPRKLCMQQR